MKVEDLQQKIKENEKKCSESSSSEETVEEIKHLKWEK